MKANAPEKLYVDVQDNFDDPFLYGFTKKSGEEDIEYTRTDAFVEKACEFMCNNIDKQLTIYHNNTWRKRDEFIEAFRQFMKEEKA